jgi:Flp pilus assembly protein TadG
MRITLSTLLRRFAKNESGTSAIEFASIVPMLAFGTIGISDVANMGMQASDMQGAVRASIQYVMNGGNDMTTAKTQGTQAWGSMPNGATINVTMSYFCGAGAGTPNTLCADGNVPTAYVTAVATGTLGGDIIHLTKTVTEKVRVQ